MSFDVTSCHNPRVVQCILCALSRGIQLALICWNWSSYCHFIENPPSHITIYTVFANNMRKKSKTLISDHKSIYVIPSLAPHPYDSNKPCMSQIGPCSPEIFTFEYSWYCIHGHLDRLSCTHARRCISFELNVLWLYKMPTHLGLIMLHLENNHNPRVTLTLIQNIS